MNKQKLRIAIIVPCYNEEEVLPNTIDILLNYLSDIGKKGKITNDSFLYFIDDGSIDNTWKIISIHHQKDPRVKGLKLMSNVGHQNALLAGLLNVKERVDCAVSIDADLQDDFMVIEQMVDLYNKGNEIVYGVRDKRETDTNFKRITALTFYKIVNIIGVKIVYNHADFRLIGKRALNNLTSFNEKNLFLRGIFPLMGFQTTNVYYNRKKRVAGKSKYTFIKMLSFAWNGITSFSVIPLRLITLIGGVVFILSIIISAWALLTKLLGKVVPGWTSTVLPLYLLGGIQILTLGIIGEYLGKIYIEVKGRPRFMKETELF